MRKLGTLADRLLSRFAPAGTAQANPTVRYEYKCENKRMYRRACTSCDCPSTGGWNCNHPWELWGLCGGV